MKARLTPIVLLFASFSFAQEEPTPIEPSVPSVTVETVVREEEGTTVPIVQAEIVEFPDVEAEFPGGADALKGYIQSNLQYPEYSRANNEQGRVYVSFVVNADGSISDINIPRPLAPSLDREAVRLIQNMPQWTPAEMNGQIVRARVRLPITFTLVYGNPNRKKRRP